MDSESQVCASCSLGVCYHGDGTNIKQALVTANSFACTYVIEI